MYGPSRTADLTILIDKPEGNGALHEGYFFFFKHEKRFSWKRHQVGWLLLELLITELIDSIVSRKNEDTFLKKK